MKCPFCDYEIKETSKFCGKCGKEIPKKYIKKKMPKLAVIIVIVLVLTAAALFFVMCREGIFQKETELKKSGGNVKAVTEKVIDRSESDRDEEKVIDRSESDRDEEKIIDHNEDERTKDKDDTETSREDSEKEKLWTLEELEQYNNFTDAEASSVLAPQSGNTYVVENLIDNDDKTAWIEGVSGYGEDEWVELKADRVNVVYGIALKNGYIKTDKTLTINAQAKSIRVETMAGVQEYTLQKSANTEGGYSDVLWFDEPIETNFVKLTILSVYPGSDYQKPDGEVSAKCEDTCITEIKVLSHV